jgi:hypothetical protein
MTLAIRIAQQSSRTYRAWRPSLPGCFVCGRTRKETHSRIALAVQGYLANLLVCPPRELGRAMVTA